MTAHTMNPTNPTTQKFKEVRDKLIELREDYDAARDYFEWPRFEEFNFALDWFDHLGTDPETKDNEALVISEMDGSETRRTFAELSARSGQLANWLASVGVKRGDRVMLMLNNQASMVSHGTISDEYHWKNAGLTVVVNRKLHYAYVQRKDVQLKNEMILAHQTIAETSGSSTPPPLSEKEWTV